MPEPARHETKGAAPLSAIERLRVDGGVFNGLGPRRECGQVNK
jgi:hypothetical protein